MSGITDPAEVYFKDGAWAWAATVWEKLISSGGRLFTALHGWDGDSWQKLPMLFGYSERWAEKAVGTAAAAGNADAMTIDVPDGYVYVLQRISLDHNAGANKVIRCSVNTGTVWVFVYQEMAAVSGQYYTFPCEMVLVHNDQVEARCTAPGDGKVINLRVWGYKMKIAE